MKHKRFLNSILVGLAMIASFMVVACADELVVVNSSSLGFDESDLIETQLGVSVGEFAVNVEGTRADEEPNEVPTGDTEIMSDFEKTVDNIWVFQYSEDGKLSIQPRYYTANESESEGTWHVLLKPVKSTIYVVTNVNSTTWASSENDITTKFQTAQLLLASTLPAPYTIYDLSETATEGHIPMQGNVSEVTPRSDGEVIVVPVEHMYAKVKVRVIIDQLLEPYNPSINSVYAQNCPWYCQIGTLYDETTKSQDDEYPKTTDEWVTRSMMSTDGGGNNIDDPNNEPLKEGGETPYEYVVYIPENIQGEVTVEEKDADAKADNLPEGHPTSIVVGIKYTDSKDAEAEASYTVYPGGNNYNNFNIRRNQVYRVTMVLGSPETQHTPSANCIVGHPGKTISFEPYYRVETGGGYDFTDYLDPTNESKTIKGYKILWQTENCIGNNSNGDLVTFELDESDPIHSKFYVKVNEPGNAVIAAYANDDCTGDIIWSWHIWVTSEDPTNISNAVTYYTYDWDADGIYGENSGRARVPGYGVMPCNLGSLSSVPATDDDAGKVATYGLVYQWGRKDPFLGLKGSGINSSLAPTNIFSYTIESTEQLYDNSYVEITGFTAGERTSQNELFYTVNGTQIENDNLGVDFSIKNPTVFMAGTYEVGTYDASGSTVQNYLRNTNNYHNTGDWLASGLSDNRLWGQSETVAKYYFVGTDDKGNDRHLCDDYGEKSIYDPCPYGWRVSPPDQWLGFTSTGLNPSSMNEVNYDSSISSGIIMAIYIQSWRTGAISYFPTQGMRAPNGSASHNRSCGNYLNATTDTNNIVNILHIHNSISWFKIFEMGLFDMYQKSAGCPIRCVRDTK